jgi:hypothetical protein
MITRFRMSLAVAALAAALIPQVVRAQGPPSCILENAVMSGTYVVSGSGSVTGVGAIATVGLIVYNGDGTGMAPFSTTTVTGVSSTSSKVPATYTVNSDCTGSKNIGGTHFNFVISPDGSTINWIVTDNGVTMAGTGIRIRR